MNFWKIMNWIFDEASCEPLYGFLCVHLYQPLFPTDQLSQNCNLGDTTWWRQLSALSMLVTVFVSLKWVTQYSGEMVMHNLCIFKVIESWQLSHNEAKIADLQKSSKRLNSELESVTENASTDKDKYKSKGNPNFWCCLWTSLWWNFLNFLEIFLNFRK